MSSIVEFLGAIGIIDGTSWRMLIDMGAEAPHNDTWHI